MKLDGQFLEALANTAPTHTLLDYRPTALGIAVGPNIRIVTNHFDGPLRDDQCEPLARQPAPHALRAVPFIADEFSGSVQAVVSLSSASDSARQSLADDRFGSRRFN